MNLFRSLQKLKPWLQGQRRYRKKVLSYHEKIADLLGQCPCCCSPDLADHWLTMLASVSLQKGDELNRLRSLTERRDWESLAKLDDWKGITDNVVLFALRCPTDCVALFELFSPFEYLARKELLQIYTLSAEESRQFYEAVVRDWKTFREAIEADRTESA